METISRMFNTTKVNYLSWKHCQECINGLHMVNTLNSNYFIYILFLQETTSADKKVEIVYSSRGFFNAAQVGYLLLSNSTVH